MRIKRLKKASKRLSFYKNSFDFHPPYQVIIDGTFSQCALKNKINLQEQMPKYLGEEVKMFSTACVITELDKLGSALYGASLIVKQFPVRRCGHEKKPISAAKCQLSLVGNKNKNHLIIATQDKSLIKLLRQIPQVPVLTMKGNAMTLLKPATQLMEGSPEEPSNPFESEIQKIKQLKVQLGLAPDEEKKKFTKKRPKAPNPLSCQKKKKADKKREVAEKKKRKRSRGLPKNMAMLLGDCKVDKEAS